VSFLTVSGLAKSFPGVRALDGVDFDLERGEIHALVGENGAGKSTLIKALGGAIVPERGELLLAAEPVPAGDPLAARRLGISIVYQELSLVPELTVAENIFLGREEGPLLRRAPMARAAQALLDELDAHVPAGALVRDLSVAQRQMVEIARALLGESRVLILDEPSATLSAPEVRRLFAVLRGLRERGLGIVYVSHRLEEIFAIADRVTVLRDGRRVATASVAGLERGQLIRWMVGRELAEEFPPRHSNLGDDVLEVRGLSCPGRFSNASFEVRRGEIVGLAGLVGAGRTSVALALFGALEARGEVLLEGRPARFTRPFQAIDSGLGYVTEDRKGRGLFGLLGAGENITITYLRAFARSGLLSPAREQAAAAGAAKDFDIRAAGLRQTAATLSGGNQQKLLLARYLLRPRKLLILDEPTRGIDVGAKAEIYDLMNRLTARGLAILMISSELPEVLAMSDRVVVMHEGRTTEALDRALATPERVMELATGGRA